MTTNYKINNSDIDDSPYNFSTYINANDSNYTNASVLGVTSRKTMVFGRQTVNSCPYGNLGRIHDRFWSLPNNVFGPNTPIMDIDPVTVIAALPTAVIFSDTTKANTYYIRGDFSTFTIENNPNIPRTLIIGNTNRSFPVQQLFGPQSWKNVSGSTSGTFILNSDNSVWVCGGQPFGQLGLNTSTGYSSPVQMTIPLGPWSQINGGNRSSYLIRSDNTLWACGYNLSGMLGLSDTTNRSSFVRVGNLSNWAQVSGCYQHTAMIKTDGTLWTCGSNAEGNLGNNSSVNQSSPIQVGTESNWYQLAIAAQSSFSFAIKSDGTIWGWGYGQFGQLGLNDTFNKSTPTQLGTNLWKKISTGYRNTVAIQSDGTLWAWGNNSYGQLGFSNTTNRLSPVQVGSESYWAQISCGYQHTLAIQSNGTLWAWGNNSFGQLGTSDLTFRSSPTQVGTANNWSTVATGNQHSLAIQSDGTLWSWGQNNLGQLAGGGLFTVLPYKIPYGI